VPEEQDVHTDHDGYQREYIKYDGCLSSHGSCLQCATEWSKSGAGFNKHLTRHVLPVLRQEVARTGPEPVTSSVSGLLRDSAYLRQARCDRATKSVMNDRGRPLVATVNGAAISGFPAHATVRRCGGFKLDKRGRERRRRAASAVCGGSRLICEDDPVGSADARR
jgi:hypothetical protein